MVYNITLPGWVDEPDGRGTWNILSTCILTIFLCCWTSVSPNVSPKSDGTFKQCRRKFDLACMTILGSEFILMLALGQWSSARKSVKKFNNEGYSGWTLKHAFFADMGGFFVEPPGDDEDYPSFPVDAEQLFQLVRLNHADYPSIPVEEIEDKSKSDGLSRLITAAQALWFLVNCIFRWVQGMFVTTLELTTLAFILVSLVTSFCWYHKPMDVGNPVTIKLNHSVGYIRSQSNAPEKWYKTPLDYLSRDECFLSVMWQYYTQILHYMRIPMFTRPTRRPYDYIPSHDFLNVDKVSQFICVPPILLFSCVFIVAWNFEFPSPTERLLWRISSISMLVFGGLGGLCSIYLHHVVFGKERKQAREKSTQSTSIQQEVPRRSFICRLASRLRNINPEKDPELDVPIRILIPLSCLCILYVFARLFILVEDFIGLRHLPKTAFQTVEWADYVPYL